MQPMMRSGTSPACAICLMASSPITVWCSSTWFSTLPRAYRADGSPAATSTASLIAMPRLPGESGSAASTALPDWVMSEGLGWTVAP